MDKNGTAVWIGPRQDHDLQERAEAFLFGFGGASGGSSRCFASRNTEITNQLDKLNKRLLDIDASFGGCLKEGNLPWLGEFLTILQGDLSFLLQITLVSTKNHGVGRRLLVAQNQISHFVDGIKTSLRCHTVDQKESLSGINILFSHNLSLQEDNQGTQSLSMCCSRAERGNERTEMSLTEYSSWPAVSRISSIKDSSSMVTCLRYEFSVEEHVSTWSVCFGKGQTWSAVFLPMVGSYSLTKWFWVNWMVTQLLPGEGKKHGGEFWLLLVVCFLSEAEESKAKSVKGNTYQHHHHPGSQS